MASFRNSIARRYWPLIYFILKFRIWTHEVNTDCLIKYKHSHLTMGVVLALNIWYPRSSITTISRIESLIATFYEHSPLMMDALNGVALYGQYVAKFNQYCWVVIAAYLDLLAWGTDIMTYPQLYSSLKTCVISDYVIFIVMFSFSCKS